MFHSVHSPLVIHIRPTGGAEALNPAKTFPSRPSFHPTRFFYPIRAITYKEHIKNIRRQETLCVRLPHLVPRNTFWWTNYNFIYLPTVGYFVIRFVKEDKINNLSKEEKQNYIINILCWEPSPQKVNLEKGRRRCVI